jgi:hypothetical protein
MSFSMKYTDLPILWNHTTISFGEWVSRLNFQQDVDTAPAPEFEQDVDTAPAPEFEQDVDTAPAP